MGRKLKGGFKTKIQHNRLINASKAAALRHSRGKDFKNIVLDHLYCKTESRGEQNPENENESYLIDEVPVAVEEIIIDNSKTRHQEWGVGRRVIELSVLAEGLKQCKYCGVPLHHHHCTSIVTYGLGAVLKVKCSNTNCHQVNDVPTGKRHRKIWDANTKLALAMVHSGATGTQINSILATLNIPPVSKNVLQHRMNEAGSQVESVAKDTASHFMRKEQNECSKSGEDMEASIDAGWQKRGSGRAYNSLSGHCSMIGTKTGKVIDYAVRSKSCRICEAAKREGKKAQLHDCRWNYDGSSKGMESEMVMEMVRANNEKGMHIKKLVADDDTTTIARIKSQIDPNIQKISDKSHVQRNFGNRLHDLAKTEKTLTKKVIKYIQQNFNYALAQNKGNPEGMASSLAVIAKHPFGDHSECPINSWCTFKDGKESKHKTLPFGKPLNDPTLQERLKTLMDGYIQQCDKLAHLGSTQGNESFNKLVASKAPKAYHFSGSANLNYRVAACVAQKNIGQKYVMAVHTRLGLSPGEITRRHAILKDVQSRKRKAISETYAAKKRRRQLRVERSQTISSTEIREGVSYESGVDMKMNTQESIDLSITPIPPPVWKPESVSLDTFENLTFFDLEATGLERDSHITQIAATRGSEEMSCYIMPKKKINNKASQVTGITTKEGRMFHFGKPVPSLSINEAINKFMQFCTITAGKVVLVGHNSKVYDCPILLNAIKNCSSTAHFETCVSGFLDTRKLFQLTYPGRKSYSQESLVQSLCNQQYQAHDALQDASSLKQLFESCNFDDVSLKESSFSLTSALDALAYSNTVATNFPSLEKLVLEKVLSECMARKIAGSGLNLKHLHIAYLRNGTDGICSLFTEGERRVRVTKSKKIIESVCSYLKKSCPEQ